MKSIFVPVLGAQSDHHALTTAKLLGVPFGATINCAHVRLDVDSALALVTRETSWHIEREEGVRSERAHAEFSRVFGSQVGEVASLGINAQWQEIVGYPSDEYAYHGRMHDIVVAAREKDFPDFCGEIVMATGRPVIVASARAVSAVGDNVLVAWNNSPESARALTAAMPILCRAKKVCLAAVPPPVIEEREILQSLQELQKMLRPHAIQAEIRIVREAQGREADALKESAYDAGCDLIVMGAYGHSRLREYLFGGVTREILKECEVPVLMFR